MIPVFLLLLLVLSDAAAMCAQTATAKAVRAVRARQVIKLQPSTDRKTIMVTPDKKSNYPRLKKDESFTMTRPVDMAPHRLNPITTVASADVTDADAPVDSTIGHLVDALLEASATLRQPAEDEPHYAFAAASRHLGIDNVAEKVKEEAQQQAPAPSASSARDEDSPPFERTRRNTLIFDHLALRATDAAPYVLKVKDRDYFQVIFANTDPRKFRYTISVTEETETDTSSFEAGKAVETLFGNLTDISVTMQHDQHFQRYRVGVGLLPGVTTDPLREQAAEVSRRPASDVFRRTERSETDSTQPVSLHEISFDLWVETERTWQLSFSGGTAFSRLTNDNFYIKTDTKGTATADDDVKTVEQDESVTDQFRPDIIALTNLSNAQWGGFGVAFSVGLNNDADPRYFVGPSYLLGGRFILHGGWAGGKVRTLPPGQAIGGAPIAGDNTLQTGATRFKRAWYIGLAFTFINREDQFKGAFTAKTEGEKKGTPQPDASPDVPRDAFVGSYEGEDANKTSISVAKATDDGIAVTVGRQDPVSFSKEHRKGLVWSRDVEIRGKKETVTVTFTAEGGKATALEFKRNDGQALKAKRAAGQ
jgi:hypothetical protein